MQIVPVSLKQETGQRVVNSGKVSSVSVGGVDH
jgi:hypothetical protein